MPFNCHGMNGSTSATPCANQQSFSYGYPGCLKTHCCNRVALKRRHRKSHKDSAFLQTIQASEDAHGTFQQPDSDLDYESSLLSMGLTIQAFQDAVREGDGDRAVSLWKVFCYTFNLMGERKYSIEALNFLSQNQAILTQRMAYRVI